MRTTYCGRAYELAKRGPTSANTCPLRIVFARSSATKEKLLSVVAETSRDKTRAAPVTATRPRRFAFKQALDADSKASAPARVVDDIPF